MTAADPSPQRSLSSQEPPAPFRQTRVAAAAIFLVCLAIYHLNGRPQAEVDCIPGPYTAWSLLRHGNFDLSGYPEMVPYLGCAVRNLPDGRRVTLKPPGSALAAVPLLAPFALTRPEPLSPTNMQHLGKLTAALHVAAAAVVFYLLCLTLAPRGAWPATVLFALGTMMYSVASMALWMHGPATFWLCLALYLVMVPTTGPAPRRAGLAGLALGLAILNRPSTALFALATLAALARGRQWRALAGCILGLALPVAGLLAWNAAFFDHAVAGGYDHDNWGSSPPLWLSVSGLLVAPSRGLLVYSPALLLAPLALRGFIRRPWEGSLQRDLILGWVVAAGATLVFYARWHDWRGGWCFGPRFLCETLPIACLLFALAYAALRSRLGRGLAVGLVALSVAIQAIGVMGHVSDWDVRHWKNDDGRCLFALRDTQIEACVMKIVSRVRR